MAGSRHEQKIAGLLLLVPLAAIGIGIGAPFIALLRAFFVTNPFFQAQEFHFSYLRAIVEFTLWQAVVSTALTALFACLLALICSRYMFWGKRFLLLGSQVPFFLPSVVVAFAFVLLYGQNGVVNRLMAWCGFGTTIDFLYNSWAIVAAHVFFNLGFLARNILYAYWEIPPEREAWALLIGLPWWKKAYYIDWAYIKGPLRNGALLIFIFCLNSFPIILLLGGGVKNTTAEVGIYQFLHGDFDIPHALLLAMLQLLITFVASLLYRLPRIKAAENTLPITAWSSTKATLKPIGFSASGICVRVFLLSVAAFLFFPLLATVGDGLFSLFTMPLSPINFAVLLGQPLINSLLISGSSALIACSLALTLSFAIYYLSGGFPRSTQVIERGIYLILGISPVVLSLAYYLYFQHLLGLRFFAWFAIIAVLAMGALPFAVKILLPAVVTVKQHCSLFEETIGLPLWRSFIAAELPGLLPGLNAAFFSCFALALGNLSVVAMFSQSGIETIPLLIYRLMGVYRFDEAAVISAVFAVFSLAIVTGSVQQQRRSLRGVRL